MEAPGSLCTHHFLQDHLGCGPDRQEQRRPRETPWAIVTGQVPADVWGWGRGVLINWGEGPSVLWHGVSPLSVWLFFFWGLNTSNDNLKVLRDGIYAGQA